MKKITGFFVTHRYAFIWTACYIFIMKFILGCLFNFNIFSSAAWVRLMHSHLHGFGGMVFGILVLAAIPMYIATTTIIIRTQKPLFKLSAPKFITRAFAPPATPAPTDATPPPTTQQPPEPTPETFPENMPTELHAVFRRMRRGGSRMQISAFDNSNISAPPQPVPVTPAGEQIIANDFPLPTDFDTPDTQSTTSDIPSFTEISFDAPEHDTPAPQTTATDNQEIISHLGDARTDGEFIIYKDMIIAVHDDADFWIADDTDWFASGKQRPSPVAAVTARAAELNLRPVLYLAQTNILDLDTHISAWEANGIRVITHIDDIDA